jgi:hypothetical protein
VIRLAPERRPTSAALLLESLRTLAQRPQLVVGLALFEWLTVHLALWPLGVGLSRLVDLRPATALLTHGDDTLLGELLDDHPELALLGVALLVTIGALWLLGGWLLGGALLDVTVLRPRRGVRFVVDSAVSHAPRLLAFGLTGVVLRMLPPAVGLFSLVAMGSLNRAGSVSSTRALLVAGAVVACAWAALSVALHIGRLLLLGSSLSVRACLAVGLQAAWSTPRPVAALALVSLGGGLLFGGGLLGLGRVLVDAPLLHAGVSALAGLLRAATALWTLIGAGRLGRAILEVVPERGAPRVPSSAAGEPPNAPTQPAADADSATNTPGQ